MPTLAAEPSKGVDTGVVTGVGAAGALIQVDTGLVVCLKRVPVIAGTLEAAHQVEAVLGAASSGVRAFVNI